MKTIERSIIEKQDEFLKYLLRHIGSGSIRIDNYKKQIRLLKSELSEPEKESVSLKERIIKLIKEGYNIEAIRTYKKEMECDLREAKYQVQLIRQESESQLKDEVRSAEIFTKNDIDLAYLTGVFNVVGLDGTGKEIERLKSLGLQPHDIFRDSQYASQKAQSKDEEQLYTREYLNECIEKATPNLSKIKDVDKELAEIRGEHPITVTDEMIITYFNNHSACFNGYGDTGMGNKIPSMTRGDFIDAIKWALSLKAQKAQPGDEKTEPDKQAFIKHNIELCNKAFKNGGAHKNWKSFNGRILIKLAREKLHYKDTTYAGDIFAHLYDIYSLLKKTVD